MPVQPVRSSSGLAVVKMRIYCLLSVDWMRMVRQALASYATLDSAPKQCFPCITRRRGTQEQKVLPSGSRHCSIVLVRHQGQAPSGWLVISPPAPNLGTDGFVLSEWKKQLFFTSFMETSQFSLIAPGALEQCVHRLNLFIGQCA